MNEHDSSDPMSYVSKLDAVMEALSTPCIHCNVRMEIVPGSGTRHLLGITHERGCPEWVDA